jgi:hypothetical protein
MTRFVLDLDYGDQAIIILALENLVHDHPCTLHEGYCDCERLYALIEALKKGGE